MARRVVKFSSDDGTLFDSMVEAEQHDRELGTKKLLLKFAESIHCYNSTSDELGQDLFDNIDRLSNIIDFYRDV